MSTKPFLTVLALPIPSTLNGEKGRSHRFPMKCNRHYPIDLFPVMAAFLCSPALLKNEPTHKEGKRRPVNLKQVGKIPASFWRRKKVK